MSEDAEQHGPAGRDHYRVVTRQLFMEDENSEDNRSQPARAEPADEELGGRSRSRPDQAQEDRQHPDNGQAEHCIGQRRPSDTVEQAGDHYAPEYTPSYNAASFAQ